MTEKENTQELNESNNTSNEQIIAYLKVQTEVLTHIAQQLTLLNYIQCSDSLEKKVELNNIIDNLGSTKLVRYWKQQKGHDVNTSPPKENSEKEPEKALNQEEGKNEQ